MDKPSSTMSTKSQDPPRKHSLEASQPSSESQAVESKDPTLGLASLSLSARPSSGTAATTKRQPKPMPNPFAANAVGGSGSDPSHAALTSSRRNRFAYVPPRRIIPYIGFNSIGAKPKLPDTEQSGTSELFSSGGKFATSATSEADTEESDVKLQQPQPWVHRQPRFKQIIQARSVPKADPKAKLKSLFDEVTEPPEISETEDEELVIDGLVPTLLPHQRRGVQFLARRENGRKYVRGGILADEMGLGKTIQSIALILYRPPTSPRAPKTTLVIAPLAVMDQWKDEIMQMAPKLRVTTHQGTNRTTNVRELAAYDVVITTYDVVTREYSPEGGKVLFQHKWHRIIADEAHVFRNPKAKNAVAMAALKSDGQRWALTGTPLHNHIMDLYPLFKFIGVSNSANAEEFKEIYATDHIALKKELKVIMLRRTQKVLSSVLPPMQSHMSKVELTDQENKIYQSWTMKAVGGEIIPFVAFTRMRQACDGLLSSERNEGADNDMEINLDNLGEQTDDNFLNENTVEETDLTKMLEGLSIDKKAGEKDTFEGHLNSKIQEVRKILLKDKKRKTVLFSSFVTMLVALHPMLDFEGIKFLQYDGGLRAEKRQEILKTFRDDKSDCVVLLCSLKAASVGLNLTSASQVIMVDPWWNPQIVDQAIKRVHRLGQVRAVDCYQLFAGHSLDERMMHIQERKRELAKNILDGDAKLSREDRDYLMYGDDDEPSNTLAASAAHLDKDETSPGKASKPSGLVSPPRSAVKSEDPVISWSRNLPKIPRHKKFDE